MPASKLNIDIRSFLRTKGSFTKDDLKAFLEDTGASVTEEALRIRIYRWKKEGFIKPIARGEYTVSNKSIYTFEADRFIKKINKLIIQKYEDVDYCVWNTHILNDFMIHQPVNAFYVLEIEKDLTESIFYYLKDNNIKAFNNPSEQIMQDYVLGEYNVIIIRPLILRAPLQKNEGVIYPSLEKILVDIFCDTHQFSMYGGQEMINIFENTFEHFIINESSLFAYATRRNKKELLSQFIKENVLK